MRHSSFLPLRPARAKGRRPSTAASTGRAVGGHRRRTLCLYRSSLLFLMPEGGGKQMVAESTQF